MTCIFYLPGNEHRVLRFVEVSLSFDVLKSALDVFPGNTRANLQTCPGSDWVGLFDQVTSELQLEGHNPSLKLITRSVHVRMRKIN